MEKNGVDRLCILGLYICFAAILVVHFQCGAAKTNHGYQDTGKHFGNSNTKSPRKFHLLKKADTDMKLLDSSGDTNPYASSSFSMAPYDSLPPSPLPQNTPPYCGYPPSTPLPPSTISSPIGYISSSPPATSEPILPGPIPIPPSSLNPPSIVPSPPSIVPSPPTDFPTPPQPVLTPPSPPHSVPSPSWSVPSPRFLPPIVYPPPTVPPPPNRASATALWCVAKASVPDPIILEAMNYACGSGADCNQIQPSGSCFQPNTLFAHASYAFNSYWQRTKATRGTCDFGGTAVLVTIDPSYDGCHFDYL